MNIGMHSVTSKIYTEISMLSTNLIGLSIKLIVLCPHLTE